MLTEPIIYLLYKNIHELPDQLQHEASGINEAAVAMNTKPLERDDKILDIILF